MSEHPIPTVGDEYDGNPIIERAVRSIYAFAPGQEHTITRSQAQGVLRFWQHHDELSPREITAILNRFPADPTGDHGWLSGSMGTTLEEGPAMTNPYDCPSWCTADHDAEEAARQEQHRRVAARVGYDPGVDGVRLHVREVGSVGDATVTVEQGVSLRTGEPDPAGVSVFDAEDLSPEQARQLVQLIFDAVEILEH